MIKRALIIASILIAGSITIYPAVSFEERSDILILQNTGAWKIIFQKSNGAIFRLEDLNRNVLISEGNSEKVLWSADFFDYPEGVMKSNQYYLGKSNSFTWDWNEEENILRFNYVNDERLSQILNIEVVIRAFEDSFFDVRLNIDNKWNAVLDRIHFPYNMPIVKNNITNALLPILPGVKLKKNFFQTNKSYSVRYPGFPGMFADYLSINVLSNSFAMFAHQENDFVAPAELSISNSINYTYIDHAFGVGTFSGSTYSTPWLRFIFSETHLDNIKALREQSGIEDYSTIQNKLGDLTETVVSSPVIKLNAVVVNQPFNLYLENALYDVPSPAILHPVGFQSGGFDNNTPDIYPPSSRWGTMEDYIRWVRDSKAKGYLVMPYSNPTWWDNHSPTLKNLPPGVHLSDVVVSDIDNNEAFEVYGNKGGYAVSAYSEFVRNRISLAVNELINIAESDLLFEDQIGARIWRMDFNAASPSPLHYVQGWYQHTREYQNKLLSTELGFDKLANTQFAFFGSVMYAKAIGLTEKYWGDYNWEVFPVSGFILRDKVLNFQHDLADETMADTPYNFIWNVSCGFFMGYEIDPDIPIESNWKKMLSVFSSKVFTRYYDELITNYEYTSGRSTKTTFESVSVHTNWDSESSYRVGEYELPPHGVLIESDSGDLIAGSFTEFNNYALDGETHYIVMINNGSTMELYHPVGDATTIQLPLDVSWMSRQAVQVVEEYIDGTSRNISYSYNGNNIRFFIRKVYQNRTVARYLLLKTFVEH